MFGTQTEDEPLNLELGYEALFRVKHVQFNQQPTLAEFKAANPGMPSHASVLHLQSQELTAAAVLQQS